MALYVLVPVLIVLLLIRFTHPTSSTFVVDGVKVVCRKRNVNGRYYIGYSLNGGAEIRVWYRNPRVRDRAYLSLNIANVRKVLIHEQ